MSVTSSDLRTARRDSAAGAAEAPLTLTTEPPRPLRLRRPAGDVGQPRDQPVRAAHRRAGRHHHRLGRPGHRWRSWSAAAWARCCSAPRPSSAPPPEPRPWCRCAGWSAGAARWCRPCSTSPRTSAGPRWRSSSSRPRPSAVLGEAWRWPFVILAGAGGDADGGPPAGQCPAAAQGHGLAGAGRVGVPVRRRCCCSRGRRSRRTSVLGFWPAVDLADRRRDLLRAAGRRLQPALPDPPGGVLGRLRSATAWPPSPTTPSASSPSPTSARPT